MFLIIGQPDATYTVGNFTAEFEGESYNNATDWYDSINLEEDKDITDYSDEELGELIIEQILLPMDMKILDKENNIKYDIVSVKYNRLNDTFCIEV